MVYAFVEAAFAFSGFDASASLEAAFDFMHKLL